MYKYSKIPISDWKHGSEHSHKVDKLTIGELLSTEYEDLIPPETLDNLYYYFFFNSSIDL